LVKVIVPSLETLNLSLPVPDRLKVTVSPSGSVAVAVAMTVPVVVFSSNELAAKLVVRSTVSSMLVTRIVKLDEVELVPSEAVKVKS